MKYETNNYELAKQDREEADKNMTVGKSDLAAFLQKRGDQGLDGEEDGEGRANQNEIDEETL